MSEVKKSKSEKKSKTSLGNLYEAVFSYYLGFYLLNEELDVNAYKKVHLWKDLKTPRPAINKGDIFKSKTASYRLGKDTLTSNISVDYAPKFVNVFKGFTQQLTKGFINDLTKTARTIPHVPAVVEILRKKREMLRNKTAEDIVFTIDCLGYEQTKNDVTFSISVMQGRSVVFKKTFSLQLKTSSSEIGNLDVSRTLYIAELVKGTEMPSVEGLNGVDRFEVLKRFLVGYTVRGDRLTALKKELTSLLYKGDYAYFIAAGKDYSSYGDIRTLDAIIAKMPDLKIATSITKTGEEGDRIKFNSVKSGTQWIAIRKFKSGFKLEVNRNAFTEVLSSPLDLE